MGVDGGGDTCSVGQRAAGHAAFAKQSKGHALSCMDGRAVFRWAVAILCDTIQDAIASGEVTTSTTIFRTRPTSASLTPPSMCCIARGPQQHRKCGNILAPPIPLALDEACAEGIIHAGQQARFQRLRAGLSWGTAIFAGNSLPIILCANLAELPSHSFAIANKRSNLRSRSMYETFDHTAM